MGKRKQSERGLASFKSEKGYLMLSTLFLLIVTGVFLQGVIKISANYIIQLNQISSAYQARAALNMSEKILKDYIIDNNNELPEKAEMSSSAGNIKIVRNTCHGYDAVITQENGVQFNKKIEIENYEKDDEETEDTLETETELLNNNPTAPMPEENLISN